MITIAATGFTGEKPQLVVVGNGFQKCEFDIVSSRRTKIDGIMQTVWERASFIAWGDEAEQIATYVERGNTLFCTGVQETSSWTDGAGAKRYKVRYGLTAWHKVPVQRPQHQQDAHPQPGGQQRQYGGGQPPRQQPNQRQPAGNVPAAGRSDGAPMEHRHQQQSRTQPGGHSFPTDSGSEQHRGVDHYGHEGVPPEGYDNSEPLTM